MDVGGLRQLIDEPHVQQVTRTNAKHGAAIEPVIGRTVDFKAAESHPGFACFECHVEATVVAPVFSRDDQRIDRSARWRIQRRTEQRIEWSCAGRGDAN